MKFLNIIFILSLLNSITILRAQSDVIAKIGTNEITEEEFRIRYELSPRILSNDLDSVDSLKLKFLYSLIAEKLLAFNAIDKGLANSEEFKFYYTPIEKIFVRDEVFKVEIKDKVKINNQDISEGINKYLKILRVKTLASYDSSRISNLYNEVLITGSIDSLSITKSDSSIQISELEIKFGDLDNEIIEDQLYNLKINEVTRPIKNKGSWFIFELTGSKPNVLEISQEEFQDEVEKIISNRRIRNLYDEFYRKLFKGFTFKANENIFMEISNVFYEVIISHLKSLPQRDNFQKYYLTEQDLLNVKEKLGSEFLERELFNTPDNSVTVYAFLSDLTIVDVIFNEITRASVNKVLSNELKRFIQQEYIYQYGVKTGVQFSNEVKFQLELWKDNLLSQMTRNSYNSQINVTDGEIEQYYNDTFSDTSEVAQINLQMLTTSDLSQVKSLLNLIEDGNSFEQIASDFISTKNVTLENISEFGKLKEFGEAMDIIAELDSGEIYGPVKTPDGYSLVKVVEKSTIPDSIKKEIENRKEDIYQRLFYQKLNELLEDRTIELANKYGVSINQNFINTELYSDINIFAHRYMGFGGRIAAVPYTTPFFKWYYRWKQNSTINPQ